MRVSSSVAIGLATASAIAAAASALADGLPRRGYANYPTYVAPFGWTGFYVGLNAGWHSSDIDVRNRGTDTGAGGLGTALALGAIPGTIQLGGDSFIGGAQAGYNWQSGTLVYGVETDIQWLNGDSSTAVLGNVPLFVPVTTTATRTLDWLGTLRARIGVTLAPQWLLYATGGLAYGDVRTTVAVSAPAAAPPVAVASSSETTFGWTLGAGTEWALDRNWSLKAEYLYYDLGDHRSTSTYSYGGSTSSLTSRSEDSGHIVRAGINYRF